MHHATINFRNTVLNCALCPSCCKIQKESYDFLFPIRSKQTSVVQLVVLRMDLYTMQNYLRPLVYGYIKYVFNYMTPVHMSFAEKVNHLEYHDKITFNVTEEVLTGLLAPNFWNSIEPVCHHPGRLAAILWIDYHIAYGELEYEYSDPTLLYEFGGFCIHAYDNDARYYNIQVLIQRFERFSC